MKANLKRLFALVLTLCLLASLTVPAALAEDEAVEASATTVAETYPIRLVDLTQTDPTAATGYSAWFKGSSGWKTNMAMTAIAAKLDTEYAEGSLNWRFVGTSDSKYYYYANVMMQPRLTDKNSWAALQIRVSKAGRYALNLRTDKTAEAITDAAGETIWSNINTGWQGDVTAYVIPAELVTSADVIPELMTEAYCVGTQSMAADQTDLTFNKVNMEKGEYVVVYTASNQTYTICEMSLLEDTADAAMYETEQVVTYPIRFADPTVASADATGLAIQLRNNDGYTNKAISKIASYIGDEYAAGTLNWKYLAEDSVAAAVYRANTALQLRSAKNGLVALQIKVPQSGFYFLTAGVDRTASYEHVTQTYAATAFDVSAYLINAKNVETVTADNIASLAVAENSVGVASLAADATSAMFERTYLDAGEYVLIYSLSTQTNIAEFGLAQRKIDMNITADGAPAVTQHIELNALESDDATIAAAGSYADISEYMNTAYAAGSVDWKVENYADEFTYGNFSFVSGKGMKVATPAASQGDWFAIRIRVALDGNYSLSLKSAGDPMQFSTYMFPATSDAMSAEEIAANMIDANGIYSQSYSATTVDAKISVGYLEGEYILAFQSIHASKSRTIYLDDIILEGEKFTAEDVQSYNFNLFDETNTAYYELITNRYTETDAGFEKIDAENGYFHSYDGVVVEKNADGTPKTLGNLYDAVYDPDAGYPAVLNWRPDAAYAGGAAGLKNDMKLYLFYNDDRGLHINLSNNTSVGATQYGSVMIHVDKAGTYDLSIDAGKYGSLVKIHFVDAFTHDADNNSVMSYMSDAAVEAILADGSSLVSDGYVTLSTASANQIGQVTVDAAGDYLVIFETKDEPINQDNDEKDKTTVDDIYLSNITLTPVVEEAAARIGNVNYASFADAIAAAEAGQTVTLLDNAVAADVELGAAVTLNLNGYALNAQNVSAIAPGAKIIDSGDGIGKLRVTGELELNENNGQLPLLNAQQNYYAFYNVDVQACATTGKVNATKYWFKVSFSNEAALELIGADTELRMQALMTGTYTEKHGDLAGQAFDATATADAAFSCAWAANSDAYIVVSAVGSSGIDNFTLNPAVSANGVVISGDAMHRGA